MRALVADTKGRAAFVAFAVVALLAVAGMSLFVFRSVAMGSQVFEVVAGTVFYDADDAYVQLESAARGRSRWDGTWTVEADDGATYALGEHGVLYDGGADEVTLLGDAWAVNGDGSVEAVSGRTAVDAGAPVLYKLADRSYLLAAPEITCEEAGIVTSPYVAVRMDRAGNAWIANHEMNVKTVQALVLAAGDVRLDVAGERLETAAEDGSVVSEVALAKIGGSTNEYEPADEGATDDAGDDGAAPGVDNGADASGAAPGGGSTTVVMGGSATAGGGSGGSSSSGAVAGGSSSGSGSASGSGANGGTGSTGGAGSGSGVQGGTGSGSSGNANTGTGSGGTGSSGGEQHQDKPADKPNANGTPQLALTGVSSDVTSVTFGYRVHDPNGAFASVYALVAPVVAGEVGPAEKIVLNAGATSKTLFGLSPNSVYRITLGYTLYKADGAGNTDKTADFITVGTKAMGVAVTVPSLSSKTITARVSTSASYPLDSAELVLYSGGSEVARQAIDARRAATTGGWTTKFANPGSASFELKLENAVYRGERVELSASCSVKNNVTHTTTS